MILTSKRKRNCQQWTLKRKKIINKLTTNSSKYAFNLKTLRGSYAFTALVLLKLVLLPQSCTRSGLIPTSADRETERNQLFFTFPHLFFSIVDFCRTASVILPYRAVLLQTRRGWASCLILDEPHVGERGRWRERCCFCCPDFYKFCYFHFFTTSKSSHEFGRADRNVAHNAGSPRVAQEKHFGSGGFPPDVSAGWSGAVQAAAATQTRDRGQSK